MPIKNITTTIKLTSNQGEYRYYKILQLRNTENVTVFPNARIGQDVAHIKVHGGNERITKVVGDLLTEKQVAEINDQARTTLVIK